MEIEGDIAKTANDLVDPSVPQLQQLGRGFLQNNQEDGEGYPALPVPKFLSLSRDNDDFKYGDIHGDNHPKRKKNRFASDIGSFAINLPLHSEGGEIEKIDKAVHKLLDRLVSSIEGYSSASNLLPGAGANYENENNAGLDSVDMNTGISISTTRLESRQRHSRLTWEERAACVFVYFHPALGKKDLNVAATLTNVAYHTLRGWLTKPSFVAKWRVFLKKMTLEKVKALLGISIDVDKTRIENGNLVLEEVVSEIDVHDHLERVMKQQDDNGKSVLQEMENSIKAKLTAKMSAVESEAMTLENGLGMLISPEQRQFCFTRKSKWHRQRELVDNLLKSALETGDVLTSDMIKQQLNKHFGLGKDPADPENKFWALYLNPETKNFPTSVLVWISRSYKKLGLSISSTSSLNYNESTIKGRKAALARDVQNVLKNGFHADALLITFVLNLDFYIKPYIPTISAASVMDFLGALSDIALDRRVACKVILSIMLSKELYLKPVILDPTVLISGLGKADLEFRTHVPGSGLHIFLLPTNDDVKVTISTMINYKNTLPSLSFENRKVIWLVPSFDDDSNLDELESSTCKVVSTKTLHINYAAEILATPLIEKIHDNLKIPYELPISLVAADEDHIYPMVSTLNDAWKETQQLVADSLTDEKISKILEDTGIASKSSFQTIPPVPEHDDLTLPDLDA